MSTGRPSRVSSVGEQRPPRSAAAFGATEGFEAAAARIRAWSEAERVLIGALRTPRTGSGQYPGGDAGAPEPGLGHPNTIVGDDGDWHAWEPVAGPSTLLTLGTVPRPFPAPGGATVDDPWSGLLNGYPSRLEGGPEGRVPGPFDTLFAAVTSGNPRKSPPAGPLPPQSRYMVRVARVKGPHRGTKRNYNYFEELERRLAAVLEVEDRD